MLYKAALTRIQNGSYVGFVIPTQLILLDSSFPIQQTLTKQFPWVMSYNCKLKSPVSALNCQLYYSSLFPIAPSPILV